MLVGETVAASHAGPYLKDSNRKNGKQLQLAVLIYTSKDLPKALLDGTSLAVFCGRARCIGGAGVASDGRGGGGGARRGYGRLTSGVRVLCGGVSGVQMRRVCR